MRAHWQDDENVSANDAEVDARFQQRRDLLNRWMMRLPTKEKRRRWGEYVALMIQLNKDLESEKKAAAPAARDRNHRRHPAR